MQLCEARSDSSLLVAVTFCYASSNLA